MKSPIRVKYPNLQSLIPQLSQFGLDPTEWQITDVKKHACTLLLKHRFQENFQMTGVYAGPSERPIWNQIFLTSI